MESCILCGDPIADWNSPTYDTIDRKYRVTINILVVDQKTADGTPVSYKQLIACRTCAKLITLKDYNDAASISP